MVTKRTLIILLIFLGLAVVFGIILEEFWNAFFSWLLIGFWILFTIKFFQKRKEFKEYNSPKNTSFFLLCPLGVGLFYNFWGFFTVILGDNLLDDSILFISPWIIIFAFPYLLYGLLTVRACYKKFDVVYLIRTRSINARKFGIFYTFLILIGIIIYMVSINIIIFNYFYEFFEQTYFYLDIMLIFVLGVLVLIFFVNGIFGSRRSIPDVSPEFIARRRRRIEGIASTPIRTTTRRPATTSTPRTTPRRPATASTPRTTTRRPVTTSTPRTAPRRPATTTTARSTARKPRAPTSSIYDKLKPKAGILSLEDFKCIFCFELPANESRGIILCPNCKHPAHADEFKDWTKSSPLCSRCDASIPPSFRKNPKIISGREYSKVIDLFKRRKN